MEDDKIIQMKIFSGDPNKLIMCELTTSNVRAYRVSRNELQEFGKREDAHNTGIYFLFGKDDYNNTTVYIGEGEDILVRLKQQLFLKDYWNVAIVIISNNNFLNKAHIKYLENEFYSLAIESARAVVTNKNTPTRSSVSEYDAATLNRFINDTKLLVNTLGYKVFDLVDEDTESKLPLFYIKAARGANGAGKIVTDGFAVLKGTSIATSVTKSYPSGSSKRRQYLIESGIINSDYVFVKDYVFNSPSSAAQIVMGRSANGLTEWKTETGQVLKTIIEIL
ncbi:MAG: GIY-YIG nuclease family protein [Eubacterium sp.]|nr:GIY-YIG nuclease family protein [Eubacterium sp.]